MDNNTSLYAALELNLKWFCLVSCVFWSPMEYVEFTCNNYFSVFHKGSFCDNITKLKLMYSIE